MKLVLAAVVVMATSSAALADYSHRWVYKGDHVGVEMAAPLIVSIGTLSSASR